MARPFQFRLRTVFLLTALVAVACLVVLHPVWILWALAAIAAIILMEAWFQWWCVWSRRRDGH